MVDYMSFVEVSNDSGTTENCFADLALVYIVCGICIKLRYNSTNFTHKLGDRICLNHSVVV